MTERPQPGRPKTFARIRRVAHRTDDQDRNYLIIPRAKAPALLGTILARTDYDRTGDVEIVEGTLSFLGDATWLAQNISYLGTSVNLTIQDGRFILSELEPSLLVIEEYGKPFAKPVKSVVIGTKIIYLRDRAAFQVFDMASDPEERRSILKQSLDVNVK